MDIEEKTAHLYGDIFSLIKDDIFYKKSQSYISRINIDKNWFNGKICLDAGCGIGLATYAMAILNGTNVYAFDLSDECLRIARNRLKQLNNIFFAQGSMENMPYRDASFDFINCNGVIHHLSCSEIAIEELFRILKPNGKLFIGVYGRGGVLNEYKYKVLRFFAKVIPYKLMYLILHGNRKIEILDNLYVPVRKSFTEDNVVTILGRSGFSGIERIVGGFYRRPHSLWEKIKMGRDGMYMHFLAIKKKEK